MKTLTQLIAEMPDDLSIEAISHAYQHVLEYFGERCEIHDPLCVLCKAWECFDYLFEVSTHPGLSEEYEQDTQSMTRMELEAKVKELESK